MKKLALGVVLAVVVLTVGGSVAAPARASGGVSPVDSPEFERGLQDLISGKVLGPSGNGGQLQIPGQEWGTYYQAGEAGSQLPFLMRSLGTLGVAATGFDIGLKIGRTIDTLFFHVHGSTGTPVTNTTVTGLKWCAGIGSACGGTFGGWGPFDAAHNPFNLATSSTVTNGDYDAELYANLTGCTFNGSTITGLGMYFDHVVAAAGHSLPADTVACNAQVKSAMDGTAAIVGSGGFPEGAHLVGPIDEPSSGDIPCTNVLNAAYGAGNWASGSCYVYDWPYQSIANDLITAPPQTFTNQTANQTITMPTTSCGGAGQSNCAPSGSLNETQAGRVRGVIDGSGDPFDWANCTLDPYNYTCPGYKTPPATAPAPPFVLPEPYTYETAEDYQSRLRELGYLGSIEIVDDLMGYPAGSPAYLSVPNRVTLVIVQQATTTVNVPVYDPSGDPTAWPAAPPVIDPQTSPDIVITRVPQGYTPPDGSTPTTGAAPPGTDTGSCPCTVRPFALPAVVTPCDKFPFGIFCWVGAQFAAIFGATPTAPSITLPTLHVPYPSFDGGLTTAYWDTPEVTWDLGTMPDSVWVGLNVLAACIVFFVWLLGLWFVGQHLTIGRVPLGSGTEEGA